MLIEFFSEKCWFNIFVEKCYNIFLFHGLVEK
jgi:hypothetical protein